MFSWAPLTQPQPILYLALGKYRHIQMYSVSVFALIRLPVSLSFAASPKTDRKSSRRHLQEQFARTWAAHYQWSSISPSLLLALAVSKHIHLSPQDVTSSSSSCLSNTSPTPRPRYLLLLALPAGLVLVSALPRNGWSTFDRALEGVGCYLTQGSGFCHCHAFHISKLQGVSPVAVGVSNYSVGQFNIGEK